MRILNSVRICYCPSTAKDVLKNLENSSSDSDDYMEDYVLEGGHHSGNESDAVTTSTIMC